MSHATPVAARSSWLGVCLALLLLGTSACGGDDPEPVVASESDAPSATQSPSPPSSPEPWEKRTKAGAVAFVEHWVDVFNQAGATGDTSELRALSAESCKSCTGYADMIDELYAKGGSVETEGWEVRQAGISEGVPLERALVGTRIFRNPEIVVRGSGSRESFPGGVANYSAFPRWRDGWVMSKFVNES